MKKFDRCVKSVRRTVKARKGSNKESAAIAICVKSVLHPRGRTIKRYRKGRLTTQKKFRGGGKKGGRWKLLDEDGEEIEPESPGIHAHNRRLIIEPLKKFRNAVSTKLISGDFAAAWLALRDEGFDELWANSLPAEGSPEPWPEFTGIEFGLGDEFDSKMDKLYFLDRILTHKNVDTVRRYALRLADFLIPLLTNALVRDVAEAAEGPPNDEEMDKGGRRRSKARSTRRRT
jgi:hypothetical protein